MRLNKLLFLLFFAILLITPNLPARDLQVTFIDVGQGDSILLETPSGKNILIDGGGLPTWRKREYNIGTKIIAPLLNKKNISRLDKVILTHGHADHVSGLIGVLENVPVREVIDTPEGGGGADDEYVKFLETVKEEKISYRLAQEGDKLDLDPALTVVVLNPPREFKYNNANDNSLVLKITYKNFSVILPADIGQVTERRLVKKYDRALKANVLKIAHHGSRTSSCATFLDVVHPELAVISSGRNNTFGHPHPEVTKRLDRKKIPYLNTAYKGSIKVTTNGETFKVTTEY
jgi:competence protein ComEC